MAGTGARSRTAQTARDMVLSMAVIGAIVAVVVLLLPRPSVRQPPIDLASASAGAADAVAFRPVVPSPLPEGWTPTATRVLRATDDVLTWRLSLTSPSGDAVAVVQAGQDATERWVEDAAGAGEERGGAALVLEDDERTVVVVGTADEDELADLAASLAPLG